MMERMFLICMVSMALVLACGKKDDNKPVVDPVQTPVVECTPKPVADAGPDQSIVVGFNLPNFVRIGTPAVVGSTYSWTPVYGLDDPTKAQPLSTAQQKTEYTLTVTNKCGTASSKVLVHVFIEQ